MTHQLHFAHAVKAGVRAFVEQPLPRLKHLFRHRKVRDHGLAKHRHQLHTLFGLANRMSGARQVRA